jgi:OOP family OmpA-OmpF porin
MMLIRSSAATAVLALLAAAAAAAQAQDAGWYIGGNGGLSAAKIDDRRISSDLLSGGYATTSINDNERDAGFKLFGGYRFDRYFALEAGYFDLGKFGFTADTLPPGALNGTIRLQGANVDAVGMLPFTDRFFAFGRFGAAYAQARDRFTGTGAVNVLEPSARRDATNYKFGAGLEYDFTEHFGSRLEAERYRVDDAVGNRGSVDLFSVGLLYRFGAAAPPAAAVVAVVAAPPVWVAPEHTAEQQPVVQPVLAPRRDIVFVFEELHFQYNRSDLNGDSRAILKRSIQILHDNPVTTVRLAGYASAKGGEEYNRKLSERRARAVEAYLISHGQIAPERLSIVGYGDTRPEEYEPMPNDINSDAAHANMRVHFEVVGQ